jgi:hypothetical protein
MSTRDVPGMSRRRFLNASAAITEWGIPDPSRLNRRGGR